MPKPGQLFMSDADQKMERGITR